MHELIIKRLEKFNDEMNEYYKCNIFAYLSVGTSYDGIVCRIPDGKQRPVES